MKFRLLKTILYYYQWRRRKTLCTRRLAEYALDYRATLGECEVQYCADQAKMKESGQCPCKRLQHE